MKDAEIVKPESLYQSLSKVKLKLKKKGGFSYASWAEAWGVFKALCPEARFRIQMNPDGLLYHEQPGGTAMVVVTVEDAYCPAADKMLAQGQHLPVMDNRNNAIKNPDARAVNDAIQRCLVKCLAQFGLGLYVYDGEDIPQDRDVVAETKERTDASDRAKDLGLALVAAVKTEDKKKLGSILKAFKGSSGDRSILRAFCKRQSGAPLDDAETAFVEQAEVKLGAMR